MSTSVNLSLVLPSKTTSLGALTYPLPTEVIATDSNPVWELISTICGRAVVGLTVLSTWKLNPISEKIEKIFKNWKNIDF